MNLNFNKLVKFIEKSYYYANTVFPRYSNGFSKKLYTQSALFTILAMKIYTKSTYRQIIDLLSLSDKIKSFLGIKKAHTSQLSKNSSKSLSESKLKDINSLIISEKVKKCELIALDGTGFTNDYADKYYAKIRKKERKSYVKNHITIDVNSRFILHYMVQRGPKYDTNFAIPAIRQIKKFKPKYILADRAYDTEPIRKCINEEAKAFDQIPLKKRAKTGHYRLNSQTVYRKKIYLRRNNV